MAATKRNAMLIEEARSKIQTTQLINRLQNHALGKIEMTKTQVSATAILLKKCVPDLTENKNVNFSRGISDLTDTELARIVAGDGGEGTVEAPSDPSQLN